MRRFSSHDPGYGSVARFVWTPFSPPASRPRCIEYLEQLTMLLFLKMADQLTGEPWNQPPIVSPELGWKACPHAA